MDDWRAQVPSATRKRNVNRIVKTLKTGHSFGDEDVLVELQKVAQNIEDKIYAGAASKFDYSQQIASKLRSMEISLKSMGTNNWRPNQGTVPNMETTDWRGQLQPESRQIIVNKIMETLKKHLPVSGQEGLHELWKIAQRFEEKIFTAATSQSDYLRKISLKMLTMETKSEGTMANNILSNQVGPSNKPPDIGLALQPQVHNPGQQHSIPLPNQPPSRQQLLSQNIQNNIASQPNLPSQVQQSQPQAPQQQLMPQTQSQPVQLQQQLGFHQQPNPLQLDMQQRLQALDSLLQQQTFLDQQKQLYQPQRPLPETSPSQTGQPNGGDWQEEVFQKIKTMKESYLPELNEMYQKIATKLQQHDSLPQQPNSDQLEKLKILKTMLERIITFLQVPKSGISPNFKEKLGSYEKQIINFINTNRPRKAMSSLQPGHLPPPHMHSMSQPQTQVTQVQSHQNQMNSQLQTTTIQGSVATMQQNNMASMLHNSMSGVSTAQQNMVNSMQPGNSAQGNAMSSLQQVPVSSLEQNPVSAPQQTGMYQHN